MACLRNDSYVVPCDPIWADALPFDSGRLQPELVGFLLHPISRSETWRRLFILQVPELSAPGAEPNSNSGFTWPTCPDRIEAGRFEEKQCNKSAKTVYLIRRTFSSFYEPLKRK